MRIKESLICGVDEAGRGPVLGPLVIAKVCIRDREMPKLTEIGVKDSKVLSSTKREEIYDKLEKSSFLDFAFISIAPSIIDKWITERKGLNALEAATISKLIKPELKKCKCQRIFVDSPSTPASFTQELERFEGKTEKVLPETKADKKRLIVGAASIIAKVVRDKKIQRMAEELGISIGSGYPSSPKTRQNLPTVLERAPQYVRQSWKTLEKLELK